MFSDIANVEVYEKFLEFKKTFFEDGVSIFNKKLKLFDNDEVFREFEERVIKNYDDSKRPNLIKYTEQLTSANEKVRHFFANLIWLYNYPIFDKKNETKIKTIKIFLDKYYDEKTVKDSLPKHGIASYGRLSQYLYFDINFIYFFTKEYIRQKNNPNEIINNINLYDSMKKISKEHFKEMTHLASKHMLNYLFDPDYYEPIVNTSCKRKIVETYFHEYNDQTLDQDIYKIREEQFGFTESLYSEICGTHAVYKRANGDQITKKIAQILENNSVDSKVDFNFDINQRIYEDDILADAEKKIENGMRAEELVYEMIRHDVNQKVLINKINELYNLTQNELLLLTQNIDHVIHYSKNYDRYAPFDLIATQNDDLLYIEVKSTTGNIIYFSRAEIKFAYNHLDNYEVLIVKDKTIYEVDIYHTILDVYKTMIEHQSNWLCENISFKIDFLE